MGSPPRLRPGTSPHALRIPPRGGHPALRNIARWRLQVHLGRVRLSPSCPVRLLHTFPPLSGQRGVTPAFGYSAPHPSARGTSTLLNNALLSTQYGAVRLPMPVHRWSTVVDLPSASSRTISRRQTRDLPVLAHGVSARAGGLRPRRVTCALALSRTSVLPSAQLNGVGTLVAPGFAAQYSARAYPLSTLRLHPCECRRMTRGHRGWLGLRCKTLPFSTPCRFIPAL
jgi:hypothetical protein